MKKIIFILTIVTSLMLTGCANLLVSTPRGGAASEDQVRATVTEMKSRLNGIYSDMLGGQMAGAQKYIDVFTDVYSSEAAFPRSQWQGVFTAAEIVYASSPQAGFNNWLWSYLYSNIRNSNICIKRCNEILNDESQPEDVKDATNIILGQAYALRAYSYSYLLSYWTDPAKIAKEQKILPYYNESNMEELQALSSYNFVFGKTENDYRRAIALLDKYNRSSFEKNYIDSDIAKILLANLLINRGKIFDMAKQAEDCTEALKLAEEVLAKNHYPIMPYKDVLTNGFNNANSANWMWASDVTSETSMYINSFWSLIDIHTYGYAAGGDLVLLDDSIYHNFNPMFGKTKAEPVTDLRYQWWEKPVKGGLFNYAPSGKFFDPVKKINNDKNWVNDICFMRIEEVYLLAAEAAFTINDEPKAKKYIKDLMLQRDTTAATATKIDALTGAALKNFISSNWRIEMWLEGKSYMAFRRLLWDHKRGQNREVYKGFPVKDLLEYDNNDALIFKTPYVEQKYNPNVGITDGE